MSRLSMLINREVARINKRRGKKKPKRKAAKRKVSKRKAAKRKVSKRKAAKRKVSKRKATSYRYMVKKGNRWVFATEAKYKRAAPSRRKRVTVK